MVSNLYYLLFLSYNVFILSNFSFQVQIFEDRSKNGKNGPTWQERSQRSFRCEFSIPRFEINTGFLEKRKSQEGGARRPAGGGRAHPSGAAASPPGGGPDGTGASGPGGDPDRPRAGHPLQ